MKGRIRLALLDAALFAATVAALLIVGLAH